MGSRIEAPSNFKEEYMKYYNEKMFMYELEQILGMSKHVIKRRAREQGLPIVCKKGRKNKHAWKIPSNFKEEYKKYCNYEISREELLSSFGISGSMFYKWRIQLDLPLYKKRGSTGRDRKIPDTFKEEYMRYYNGEISLSDLKNEFQSSQALLRKWRITLGLPVAPHRQTKPTISIPSNFKEEYLKYCDGLLSMKELSTKFNVSSPLCLKWRDALDLPINPRFLKNATNHNRKMPENFKEEYMRYYNNELSKEELMKNFNIGKKLLSRWKAQLNIHKKKTRFRPPKDTVVPENFQEEYTKYLKWEMSQEELLTKFNISLNTFRKLRNKLNLPFRSREKYIPIEEFKEEYMKLYNQKITKDNLLKKFRIDKSTLYKLRKKLNLPYLPHPRKIIIPENFKEEYMKFYKGYITSRGLCKEFNITEETYRRWRDELNLPKTESRKDKVPEGFKEDYMKFFYKELSQAEILKKFEISEHIWSRWRKILNLPMVAGSADRVPRNFKEEYMKFYNKELSMKDLCEKFNVSDNTCRKWRDLLELPTVEKCRNRQGESSEPIDLSDEFPDKIEY